MPDTNNARRNIYAQPEAWREIEEAARKQYMTLSAYIIQAALEKARKEKQEA